ncbi:putative deoxyhypusine synthase [Gorgonomyces haynaldii]|nr:putative deoxyhypusine synthase [Gorgonomyces haynaldii]
MPNDSKTVKGYEFNNGIDFQSIMDSYLTTGYQATHLGKAIEIVNDMIHWRLSDDPIPEDETEEWRDLQKRKETKCKIFLGFTSNLVSSGLRETIRYLVEHKMVDVVVASAGGIEEDFIKCLGPTHLGAFDLNGQELRKQGLNRIGNLLVPNDNYCKFEDWVMPILDQMLEEQKQGTLWTPSKLIHRLGKEINDPSSIYYWAYKNDIPVYCPALTDGSLGDMIYFHSFKNPGTFIDDRTRD